MTQSREQQPFLCIINFISLYAIFLFFCHLFIRHTLGGEERMGNFFFYTRTICVTSIVNRLSLVILLRKRPVIVMFIYYFL